ncbi:Ubiquitin-protein ligase [Colletotrichum higginsianum IMI 349063]|uniref:Ubiquitin-protein ligase n=2 Tax=Colletotrichum higginsianum TaxID=80884 RepID=A0A1B7YA47_COLHI|nr:Ubiquitin-protein ligase [Colletotrichum higginsianum IMI 349063]OBR08932.1 Ubiquitin-protein ligase [Colletotrichum higginsianum IMI 349063]TIC95543.1 Protein ASI3 [Colletotrichum higginsianum]
MDTAQQPITLDNLGVWQNLSLWTADRLQYAVNVTKLAPSLEDLVWAGPRMIRKLTAHLHLPFPDSLEALGQRVIPEATGPGIMRTTDAVTIAALSMDIPPPIGIPHGPGPGVLTDPDTAAASPNFSMEGAKGLGSVFSYATSKWALCCIAMAIVLNRTHIFAATRRRLRLTLPVRLLLRGLPVLLFLVQARGILRSIQCQTSPDFSELRWGNTSKSSELMFSQAGGFLHTMSSALLLGASDEVSCTAVGMVPVNIDDTSQDLRGSLSLLWPLFGTFCLSQFLETVSCAVQGRPVAAETGMTLFEHSLAFAEADAAISNQLGWGLFTQSQAAEAASSAGGTIAISRSMILRRVNTSPEVLLVAFLSTMSHITSHVLGIFNLQAKFRLVSTGFWGLCFMASILWSAFTFSLDDPARQGLLRFPTVCIIGFIPHVLVLGGIIVCLIIYLLALGLAALGQTGQRLTLRERLAQAHGNMQANLSVSDIRVSMEMDFYTALLRTGFGAITMASEAVYLNEDRDVIMRPHTWLEEERYQELEELRTQWIAAGATDSHYDTIGTIGLVPVKEDHMLTTNGYVRERAAQKVPKSRSGERRLRDGVGAAERSGRWLMALDFLMNINRLIFRTWATAMLKILSKIGIRHPKFLLWVIRRPKLTNDTKSTNTGGRDHPPADSVEASLNIPRIDGVDVESEFRQQAWSVSQSWAPVDEADLDSKLYGWWLRGGWWGTKDNSGEYQPPVSGDEDGDDDTTSVLSFSTNDEREWESEGDGQRTPTQSRSWVSREATPMPEDSLQLSDLARLLHPSNPEEREEAYALAAHLGSDRIMTRSQYRRSQQLQRTRILQPAGRTSRATTRLAKMTPDEESQRLEQLLLSRRAQSTRPEDGASTWAEGAAGLGPDGPQCVVCQSSPRTIIVWPCRCLSLCDDCRVSLAMNNFDKCVCCRREVISFSRIYVP